MKPPQIELERELRLAAHNRFMREMYVVITVACTAGTGLIAALMAVSIYQAP